MALKATIFKVQLQISDLDRHYYQTLAPTIARHPSESDERMMVRLLAFAWFADPALSFTKGLCADDEPDLWQHSLSGEIERWIELGQPDERRLRKACGRAREVVVVNYGGRAADIWWQQNGDKLARLSNLAVMDIPAEQVRASSSAAWICSAPSTAARRGSPASVPASRLPPPGVSARAVDLRWCQAGFRGLQCRHPSSRAWLPGHTAIKKAAARVPAAPRTSHSAA